ncbi:FAD-binding oxidoreductase, partial [Rhodococcus oxybenzonivorans]
MQWDAWGAPEKRKVLSDGIKALLQQALGVSITEAPERDPDDVVLAPSALSEKDQAALATIVGERFCSTAHTDRLLRAGGKSTLDLLRRRSSEPQDAPDAVITPGTDDEVGEVLRYCTDNAVAVVPFGGGTSVVGGLDPVRDRYAAVVSLDLRRFDTLLDLDAESGVATLGAGVTGPHAEELLGVHGLSLGHFPQSFRFATIG